MIKICLALFYSSRLAAYKSVHLPDAWYKGEGLECRKAKPSPGGKFNMFNGKVFNSFSGAEDMVSANFYLSFVFTIVSLVTCTSCMLVESLVTSRKNVFLKGRVVQRQLTKSQLSCAHLCARINGCTSFNYNFQSSDIKRLCELLNGSTEALDNSFTERAGWIFGQVVSSQKKSEEQGSAPGKITMNNKKIANILKHLCDDE